MKSRQGNSAPTRAAPYTIPVHYFDKVRGEIKTMLEIGIIERTKSQWASPLITVLKKDGSIRLCGDYRRLNAITEADPYYLPRIEDLLFKIGQAKFITTLDLCKGFYQIPMAQVIRRRLPLFHLWENVTSQECHLD